MGSAPVYVNRFLSFRYFFPDFFWASSEANKLAVLISHFSLNKCRGRSQVMVFAPKCNVAHFYSMMRHSFVVYSK